MKSNTSINQLMENSINQDQETISDSFSWRLKKYQNNYDSSWLWSLSAGYEASPKFSQVKNHTIIHNQFSS